MTMIEMRPQGIDIPTVKACQVEIPPTSKEQYITGIYALNVPCPDGTTGDWHDVFHWREDIDQPATVMLGGTPEVDTNHIYKDLGVYEGHQQLQAKGLALPEGEIYVANHYRAILDMLFRSLRLYGKIYNLNCATVDWLDTPEQQTHVLELATRMAEHLPESAQDHLAMWIESERARG